MHNAIQMAYSKLSDKEQYREKPLGSYYRVSFYGKVIVKDILSSVLKLIPYLKGFEDENGKVYIYKEPGGTKLYEICERLRKLYTIKLRF